jgi:hypothetical protein
VALFLPVFFFCGRNVAPLLVMSQHRRSFVFKVLVKELSIRSIWASQQISRMHTEEETLTIIRWRYPFPWYNAWESYAYASGAVDPAWRCAAGELFTEVRGEVVAVFGEEVVGCALELERRLVDDGVQVFW